MFENTLLILQNDIHDPDAQKIDSNADLDSIAGNSKIKQRQCTQRNILILSDKKTK